MRSFSYPIPEEKKVRVILDTDCACEADDPYAIVHALLSCLLYTSDAADE